MVGNSKWKPSRSNQERERERKSEREKGEDFGIWASAKRGEI